MTVDTIRTSTDPRPPERGRRPSSGTIFVIVSALLVVGFVLFLVFVSPVLLARTLALAPSPAPQVVASGELDGRRWSATALDSAEDQRGVDERGFEAVVEPAPCLVIDLGDGEAPVARCVERRGGSIRDLHAVTDASGRALLVGVVAPEVATVALDVAGGAPLEVAPTYVDFGFPLGFFVTEVDAGTAVRGAEAFDRDGVLRSSAVCTGAAPFAECIATEGDY